MPSPKEQILFNQVKTIGESKNRRFEVLQIEEDICLRYRVLCGSSACFEIARIRESEEFHPKLDEEDNKRKYWYTFDGKIFNSLPAIDINSALKLVFDESQ